MWLDTKTVLPLGGELPDERAELADAGGVEAVGRLIEDHEFGIVQDRCRDGEALAHAERVRARLVAAPRRQADEREHLVDARVGDARIDLRPEAQVVARRHVREVRLPFERRAGAAEGFGEMRARVEAEEFGVAAGRRDEAEHRADGRGLAGAVGAEEAEDASTAHFDVERIDGGALAVALRQPDGAQHDLGLWRSYAHGCHCTA